MEENSIKPIRHRRIPVKSVGVPDMAVHASSIVPSAFFIVV
jgi:hypothetical protein